MNTFEGTFITSESINVLCLSLNLFQVSYFILRKYISGVIDIEMTWDIEIK